MPNLRSPVLAAAIALVSAWSAAALADLPPPPPVECSGGVGTVCTNAGASADQPGICVAATCTLGPEPLADGGSDDYPCVLCELADAGSSTSSSSSSSGAVSSSSSSSGGASSSSSSSGGATPSGGCTVGVASGEGAAAGAMVMVGLGVLASRRRRRGQAPGGQVGNLPSRSR